jgi:hypothetical protein
VRVSAGQNFDEFVQGTKMVEAFEAIQLRCGKSEIHLEGDGTIKIKGVKLFVAEDENIRMTSTKMELN